MICGGQPRFYLENNSGSIQFSLTITCTLHGSILCVKLITCFEHFHKYVTCQFDAKAHIFQSDEGGEFSNIDFTKLFANLGIHHQYACPKTLEQNGTTERKHRNITELGLTMMFDARLPPRFWVECFSTVVFPIN